MRNILNQTIDCKDEKSIVDISNTLKSYIDLFTNRSLANLASQIVNAGLMEVEMPWFVKLIGKFRKIDHISMARLMLSFQPHQAHHIINATADHVCEGKDNFGEGVGGFNQNELEDLVDIMEPFNIILHNELMKEVSNV